MATQGPKHHAHVPFATVLFTLASSPLDFFVIISLKSAFEAIWIDGCSDNDIFWICMATRFYIQFYVFVFCKISHSLLAALCIVCFQLFNDLPLF